MRSGWARGTREGGRVLFVRWLWPVACVALTAFVLVWGFPSASSLAASPAIRWSSASIQAPPGGVSDEDQLSVGNVSCLSRTDCEVAGFLVVPNPKATSATPASFYTPLLWRWDGKSWTFQKAAGKGSLALVGSACVSATDCWAVGAKAVGPTGGQSSGVIEHYDGSSWSLSSFPSPAGAAFNGVTCTSADDCWVAGNRQTSSDTASVLIEHWDGKSWSPATSPSPSGAMWSVLDSASCLDADECFALGDADNSTKGSGYFFVERFNGKSWKPGSVPNGQKFNMGDESGLFEISCPSSGNCLAVGTALAYTDGQLGADFPDGVAESWNGKAWKVVKVPGPAAGGTYLLNNDSCVASDDCWVALGYPSILGPLEHPMPVAHWNGSSFSVSVETGVKGFLAAIACAPGASTWCVTIGEAPAKSKAGAKLIASTFLADS